MEETIKLYPECLPEDLKKLPFVLHGKGDNAKVPLQVNGLYAKVDDRKTWSSFKECLEAFNQNSTLFGGIGLILVKGVVCIDIDDCIKEGRLVDVVDEKGHVILTKEEIEQIVEQANTYAEISPSGTGLHIFGYGSKNFAGCKKNGIEVYDRGRFIRITGYLFNTDYDTVSNIQKAVEWLGDKYFDATNQKKEESVFKGSDVDESVIGSALKVIPSDDYDIWIRIGMALKNTGHELKLWEEWSKSSPKFMDGECFYKWNSFKKGGLGIGTIIYLAKQYGFKMPKSCNPLPNKSKFFNKNKKGDIEVLEAFKKKTNEFRGLKNIEVWKSDTMWFNVFDEASKDALKMIMGYVDDVIPNNKRKNFRQYLEIAKNRYFEQKETEYRSILTKEQLEIYEQQVRDKALKKFPEREGKDKPVLKSKKNLQFLLEQFGALVKLNVITRREEVYIDGEYSATYTDKMDTFYVDLMLFGKSIDKEYDIGKKLLMDLMRTVIKDNEYNPLKDYFERCYKDWDRKQHLEEFLNCLDIDDEPSNVDY